ncbi:hypothetical protein [Macrococcus bovicus]|uniref:Phage protein n=1 Tax=Macrococcus bovicus TaxID=69968 RepID=A0A4R6BWM1_9STAP|nr:hypothetical protein [Macrococcus bovicus]TDM12681.1 hypothetical protein ERX55_10520 [Macrococcus bovicus]
MKNTLGDLNGYLFEQLERLSNPEMTEEEMKLEIERARTVTGVASQVISNGNLVLKAKIAYDENLQRDAVKPKLLEG